MSLAALPMDLLRRVARDPSVDPSSLASLRATSSALRSATPRVDRVVVTGAQLADPDTLVRLAASVDLGAVRAVRVRGAVPAHAAHAAGPARALGEIVARAPSLESLEIRDAPGLIGVLGQRWHVPARLPAPFRRLSVENCPDLRHLPVAAHPGLERVVLSYVGLSVEELRRAVLDAPGARTLRDLRVVGCGVFRLPALAALVPALRRLEIGGSQALALDARDALASVPPTLQHLVLEGHVLLGTPDAGLGAAAAAARGLRSLAVHGWSWSNLPRAVAHHPALRQLGLFGCRGMRNLDVSGLPRLERLVVDRGSGPLHAFPAGCLPGIGGAGGAAAAAHPSLREVVLEGLRLPSLSLATTTTTTTTDSRSVSFAGALESLVVSAPVGAAWLDAAAASRLAAAAAAASSARSGNGFPSVRISGGLLRDPVVGIPAAASAVPSAKRGRDRYDKDDGDRTGPAPPKRARRSAA